MTIKIRMEIWRRRRSMMNIVMKKRGGVGLPSSTLPPQEHNDVQHEMGKSMVRVALAAACRQREGSVDLAVHCEKAPGGKPVVVKIVTNAPYSKNKLVLVPMAAQIVVSDKQPLGSLKVEYDICSTAGKPSSLWLCSRQEFPSNSNGGSEFFPPFWAIRQAEDSTGANLALKTLAIRVSAADVGGPFKVAGTVATDIPIPVLVNTVDLPTGSELK
eukprot:9426913-Pyramimonas_sp.AAC.1